MAVELKVPVIAMVNMLYLEGYLTLSGEVLNQVQECLVFTWNIVPFIARVTVLK
jgi:hypothetical protein